LHHQPQKQCGRENRLDCSPTLLPRRKTLPSSGHSAPLMRGTCR
jgi:hypothetical protein